MKSKIKKSILIVLLIFIVLLISSCKDQDIRTNIFDPRYVKQGDVIANMRIESVDVYTGMDVEDEESYLATVKFTGETTLSGKYISYLDQPLWGRSILFFPDDQSQVLLPRLSIDTGEVWLQIENYDTALDMLGQPGTEGEAEIVIDDYTINYSLEVVYTAKIVEVIDNNQLVMPEDEKALMPEETQELEEYKNHFNASQTRVGDVIAGMEITSIDITQNPNNQADYWASVEFEGQTTISGVYKFNVGDEFLGDSISFRVDENSKIILPKLAHDTRFTWFVFSNQDLAKDIFGPPGSEGTATIIIDNYIINYAPTEVWNTAELIELLEKQ